MSCRKALENGVKAHSGDALIECVCEHRTKSIVVVVVSSHTLSGNAVAFLAALMQSLSSSCRLILCARALLQFHARQIQFHPESDEASRRMSRSRCTESLFLLFCILRRCLLHNMLMRVMSIRESAHRNRLRKVYRV
jgi:hypothetical protein